MIRTSDGRVRSGASQRWVGALWVGLCCVGILAPSSVGGVMSVQLSAFVILGMLAFSILLILASGRLSSRWGLLLGVVTATTPWLITWMRMDDHVALGLGAQFLLLGLVFSLPMSTAPAHWMRRVILPVIESLLAICAVGVMAGVPTVGRLLVKVFSQYYEVLVPNMVALHRPVGPFGTHSVAAFAYYLLFFVHLRSYARRESLVDLSWASFWLIAIAALSSSTAAAMLILGILDLVWSMIRSRRALIRRIGVAVAVASVGWSLGNVLVGRWPLIKLINLVSRVIGNSADGLLSRYNTTTGVMRGVMLYLHLHPFAPIGLADFFEGSGSLAGQNVVDSGVLQFLLRIGPAALGALYGGLWVFLRAAVGNKRVAVWLWGVTLAFELGFSALLVQRLVALMILTAVCLGDIYAGDRETTLTRSGV